MEALKSYALAAGKWTLSNWRPLSIFGAGVVAGAWLF
jgi:hypothetical protein